MPFQSPWATDPLASQMLVFLRIFLTLVLFSSSPKLTLSNLSTPRPSNPIGNKLKNILSSPLPFSYDENMFLCHPDATQATSNFTCPKIKAHPASSPQRLLFLDLSTPIPIQMPTQIETSESLSQIFPVLLNPYPTGHQGLSLQCLITPLFPPPSSLPLPCPNSSPYHLRLKLCNTSTSKISPKSFLRNISSAELGSHPFFNLKLLEAH